MWDFMKNIAKSIPSVSKYGITGTTSNEEEMKCLEHNS